MLLVRMMHDSRSDPNLLMEYDGTNVLQARYTHGPGIDEPIAVTKGSSTYFYYQDGLGSVTDLTDSTGATAKSYAYDAYGNILESPGTVEQAYSYTGREFDPESGLYHYRARAYDSTVGRFTQKDPLGIGGGVNLYVYVKGNPSNRKDPSGLKEVIPSLGGEILGEIAGFILEQGVGGVTGAVCASRYCKRKKANVVYRSRFLGHG